VVFNVFRLNFLCHLCLILIAGIEKKMYDNVYASCYVETWSANAICQGILGPSGWGVMVYKLYAVYTCMGFMYDLL